MVYRQVLAKKGNLIGAICLKGKGTTFAIDSKLAGILSRCNTENRLYGYIILKDTLEATSYNSVIELLYNVRLYRNTHRTLRQTESLTDLFEERCTTGCLIE